MATVYKIELVSDWVNFAEEEVKRMLEEAIKQTELPNNNEIRITVERK